MSPYFDRYLQGAYEEVWAEMVAVGEHIRDDEVLEDARQVATETMRRARTNIQILIPRLVRLGYQFGFGWIQPSASDFGWQQRKEWQERLAWARGQSDLLSVPSDVEEELADARLRLEQLRELQAPDVLTDHWQRRIAELDVVPRAATTLDQFEQTVGVLPLSLRAWYEGINSVNFVGTFSPWLQLLNQQPSVDRNFKLLEGIPVFADLDPLHMLPLAAARVVHAHTSNISDFLAFAPNGASTFGHEGSFAEIYGIHLPCLGADATMRIGTHEMTFVEYLRLCFRWGGFPGWERLKERPVRDIDELTTDLLPL